MVKVSSPKILYNFEMKQWQHGAFIATLPPFQVHHVALPPVNEIHQA